MPDEPRDSEQNEDTQPQADVKATNPSKELNPQSADQVGEALEGQLEPEFVETVNESTTEADGDAAATDPLAELQQALLAERARADENYDLALRTKAEMDNLRKRSANEVDKARKFALEKFATEMLAVRDSLEMGLEAANKDDADLGSIRQGTDLTLKMLASALEKFQVEEINPMGQIFDPELHQAMGMQENPDVAPNTVMLVMQKGYTLNGRLIRPAMVMVSKG